MADLKLVGFMEELQDYIAANADLGLVVGSNFTIGESFETDLQDFVRVAPGDRLNSVSLVMYDEGGDPIPGDGIAKARRSVRFVQRTRDNGQSALNELSRLLEWVLRSKRFPTPTFRILVERASRLPGTVAANRAGEYLAELVLTFLVLNR